MFHMGNTAVSIHELSHAVISTTEPILGTESLTKNGNQSSRTNNITMTLTWRNALLVSLVLSVYRHSQGTVGPSNALGILASFALSLPDVQSWGSLGCAPIPQPSLWDPAFWVAQRWHILLWSHSGSPALGILGVGKLRVLVARDPGSRRGSSWRPGFCSNRDLSIQEESAVT